MQLPSLDPQSHTSKITRNLETHSYHTKVWCLYHNGHFFVSQTPILRVTSSKEKQQRKTKEITHFQQRQSKESPEHQGNSWPDFAGSLRLLLSGETGNQPDCLYLPLPYFQESATGTTFDAVVGRYPRITSRVSDQAYIRKWLNL